MLCICLAQKGILFDASQKIRKKAAHLLVHFAHQTDLMQRSIAKGALAIITHHLQARKREKD